MASTDKVEAFLAEPRNVVVAGIALMEQGRVLLAITPDRPPSGWTRWGLD